MDREVVNRKIRVLQIFVDRKRFVFGNHQIEESSTENPAERGNSQHAKYDRKDNRKKLQHSYRSKRFSLIF